MLLTVSYKTDISRRAVKNKKQNQAKFPISACFSWDNTEFMWANEGYVLEAVFLIGKQINNNHSSAYESVISPAISL